MTMQNSIPAATDNAGPASVVETLQAFRQVQERRVAHWKEYNEALQVYERTNLYADNNNGEEEQNEVPGNAHRCGQTTLNNAVASSHYHTTALPMTDGVFQKILALVTSGLLDCSHCTRTIETELRVRFARQDLGQLVDQVQQHENAILRAIVARDQAKRIAKIEQRQVSLEEIANYNTEIAHLQTEVSEVMTEISAEIAAAAEENG